MNHSHCMMEIRASPRELTRDVSCSRRQGTGRVYRVRPSVRIQSVQGAGQCGVRDSCASVPCTVLTSTRTVTGVGGCHHSRDTSPAPDHSPLPWPRCQHSGPSIVTITKDRREMRSRHSSWVSCRAGPGSPPWELTQHCPLHWCPQGRAGSVFPERAGRAVQGAEAVRGPCCPWGWRWHGSGPGSPRLDEPFTPTTHFTSPFPAAMFLHGTCHHLSWRPLQSPCLQRWVPLKVRFRRAGALLSVLTIACSVPPQ